ncbi:hypothetical protein F9841_04190 [Glaesserella parasuis]|nr:hypothetical protein [Glaesserella parasuis]MWQ74285.1 hypothetical protein [Glaesserella parasuis]MWQ85353.1 hypothetical protein [Glaesserella parasuis]MXO42964.1 hypothetical protein [Glaesserella parasuis]MXO45963.1 hypothetical protein [Glaesserella parasuis]
MYNFWANHKGGAIYATT